jgi:hypothetical protein
MGTNGLGPPAGDEDQDAPIDAPEALQTQGLDAADDDEDEVDDDEAFANDEIPDDS